MTTTSITTKRPIRLLDLEQPLEPVELPSGRVVPVRPLDAIGYKLYREIEEHRALGDVDAADATLLQCVARCIPEATEEERGSLTPAMLQFIVAYAGGLANAVLEELLGNGEREPGAAESPAREAPPRRSRRRRSTPATPSATSSPA